MQIHCAHTKIVDTDSLIPNPHNPNQHPQAQIELLAKILKYQGWRNPIVVSKRSGYITKGHGRLMAAKLNKWAQCPIDEQEYATEADEYADMIADNKIAELAESDDAKIQELALMFPEGFDLDLLGIPEFTIVPPETVGQTDPDEIPEKVEPRARLGDMYQLGAHRLMCGDSTSIDAVEKLMSGEKADMVFTDPPYGMFLDTDYDSMFGTDEAHRKTGKRFEAVKGDNADFAPELINTIFAAFDYCQEVFLWGADYYSELLPDRKDGSWVVWDKRCGEQMDKVSGNTFELCWSKQKHKRLIARILWSGHHGMQGGDTKKRVHPTQKPAKLVEWFFENWGSKCASVVDLFGGSGSTLIACEKTNRRCFMMELDPHYVDVIVARWEAFTGKKAELLNREEVVHGEEVHSA